MFESPVTSSNKVIYIGRRNDLYSNQLGRCMKISTVHKELMFKEIWSQPETCQSKINSLRPNDAYGILISVNTGSDNGLLLQSNRPLPEPIRIWNQSIKLQFDENLIWRSRFSFNEMHFKASSAAILFWLSIKALQSWCSRYRPTLI